MTVLMKVREGSTEPITFVMKERDRETNVLATTDLTGYTKAEIRLRSKRQKKTQSFDTDDAELSCAFDATGEVVFRPAATTLEHKSEGYWVRFVLTNASAKAVHVPSERDDEIEVLEAW